MRVHQAILKVVWGDTEVLELLRRASISSATFGALADRVPVGARFDLLDLASSV